MQSQTSGLAGPGSTTLTSISIVNAFNVIRRMNLPLERCPENCPEQHHGVPVDEGQRSTTYQLRLGDTMDNLLAGERGLCLDCVMSETTYFSCQGRIEGHGKNYNISSKTWDELVAHPSDEQGV